MIKIEYFLGVDGGGSSTKIYLTDYRGKIISAEKGAASNYQVLGLNQSLDNLSKIIDLVCKKADINLKKDRIFTSFGLAGIDSVNDIKNIKPYLKKIESIKKFNLYNDSDLALAGANAENKGLVLISGTGSIAVGIDAHGYKKRAGGWGHLFDDKGSGYYIAIKALETIFAAYDGRAQKTILTDIFKQLLEVKKTEAIVEKVYANNMSRHEIAALAKYVFSAAERGDVKARLIISQAAKELSRLITAIISDDQFDFNSIINQQEKAVILPLVGGVFNSNNKILKNNLKNEIELFLDQNCFQYKKVKLVKPILSPAAGGIILSLKENGYSINKRVISNLKKDTLY